MFGQGANVSMESDVEDAWFGSHLEGMSSGVVDRSAPNSDGSAKAGQGEQRRKQLQRKRQRQAKEGTPTVDVVHGFIAPVEFDFRICVPLCFCLRYRRLETLFAYAGKEVEENDADSWRHGSLHAVDERAQPTHTRRGTKDAHVASLDEGLARELRDHTRFCTRVQCQGRGRGLEKSNINSEEHQYLHYQMAWGKITAWRASCWVLVIGPLTTANTTLVRRVNKILSYKSSEHILQAFSCCRHLQASMRKCFHKLS